MQVRKEAILMLTDGCNVKSRCKYCYISPFGKFLPEVAARTTETLLNRGYHVTLTGAEVLSDPGYLECYKKAGQNYILSNGILLSKKSPLIDRIRESGIEEVRLSFNFGLPSFIWSIPSKTVENAASVLLDEGFRVSFASLVTVYNYVSVPYQCKRAMELGASEITFFRYLKTGGAALDEGVILPDSMVPRYFQLVYDARESCKGAIRITHNLGFGPTPRLKRMLESRGADFCPAGKFAFTLTPDNKVYACPGLIGPGLEIGFFSEGDLHITREALMQRDTCIANPALMKFAPVIGQ